MKKILLTLMALAAGICLSAQEECSTAWPYLYPEFREGTVYLKNGSKLQYQVNVHTLHGKLHYLDGGVVKEAVASELLMVRIGDDEYMEEEGSVMKVLARNGQGFVAALILGDFDKLSDSAGAYGSSTTSSATRKLSSLDLAGKVNQNHMEMWENRHGGETVDLVKTYYIVTGGKVYKATQKAIAAELDADGKAAFKTWLKSHKIKWKDADSLLGLVEFLNQ